MSTNVEMNIISDNEVQVSGKQNCCVTCTNTVVHALEYGFARIGSAIANNSVITILVSVGICLLFFIGLKDMYSENRPEKLWVASDSKSLDHSAWYSRNYPPETRICTTIVEDKSGNILTKAGLATLCNIDEGIKKIAKNDSTTPNLAWNNKCFSPARNGICAPSTILQLWQSNCNAIRLLNDAQILAQINSMVQNPAVMSQLKKIDLVLGGITYDSSTPKKIVKAKAAKMTYFLKNEEVYDKKQGRRVDVRGKVWEEEFSSFMKNTTTDYSSTTEMTYYSLTSRNSDSGDTIGGDLILLAIGYVLIIVYLAVMLGAFSRISHKVWLAICGVVVIGLSFGVSYGLSSACQLIISPVHNVLPFLLLGIGVDDVFVIVRTWDNVCKTAHPDATVPEKISQMLRHAGCSILVTSLTDICAFLIGATTVLPALRSFCVYAGIGIIAVFLLTCTFFVAWLSLDSRRERDFRDACCCCIKYDSKDWSPMDCSKRDNLQSFFKNVYTKALLSLPGRIIVLVVWAGILAGGAYGLSQLKQDFDPDWFLPTESMTIKFKAADKKLFPDGVNAAIYCKDIDYYTERGKLDTMYQQIEANKYVVNASTVSWYKNYIAWLKVTKSLSDPRNESEFYTHLNEFLASTSGMKFKSDVKMDVKTKKIKASRIRYSHIKLTGASEEIKAMDSIQEIAKNMKFKTEAFGYTRFYVSWETNKVISTELIRNLVLAGVVVLLITLFLLADFAASFMVLMCMVLTLVDIAGYMHYWGATVDTVTTILLVLAIGLSIDYSAHVAHAFLASRKGNRVERARSALITIGPAVFHGGFSTFLAFICLAGSKSYVFNTFFKLFFLVVVFGMFHGLVFLPVLLSFIGSRPYASFDEPEAIKGTAKNEEEMKSSEDNPQYQED